MTVSLNGYEAKSQQEATEQATKTVGYGCAALLVMVGLATLGFAAALVIAVIK